MILANGLNSTDQDSADPNVHIPLPPGMSFLRPSGNHQLQISLDDTIARRHRRVFGYVGEIQLSLTGKGAISTFGALFAPVHMCTFGRLYPPADIYPQLPTALGVEPTFTPTQL